MITFLDHLAPRSLTRRFGLFFIQIFAGDIIFRNFVGSNFLLIRVVSLFHAADDIGLECIAFFKKLVNAFRIRPCPSG